MHKFTELLKRNLPRKPEESSDFSKNLFEM
jgi:hypothetical protein